MVTGLAGKGSEKLASELNKVQVAELLVSTGVYTRPVLNMLPRERVEPVKSTRLPAVV